MTDPETPDTLALAKKIADLVRERRGQDLVLLDVRALVDYTDFFLVVTGQSARQNLAIAEHVVKSLKGEHRYAISKSGLDSGSWICLDMADVVVHVFDPETRAKYDLELLWADAPRVPLAEPLPAKPLPSEAAPAAKAEAEAAVAEEPATPKRRRRVVRQEAIPDADLENAPDAARPPEGEPEPEEKPRPLPPKLPKGKPREAPIATVRPAKAASPKAAASKAAAAKGSTSKGAGAKPSAAKAAAAKPAAKGKASAAKPTARAKSPRPRRKG